MFFYEYERCFCEYETLILEYEINGLQKNA